MGWGKFLGDLAKDYISEQGIEGALEDAGALKDKVSKFLLTNICKELYYSTDRG